MGIEVLVNKARERPELRVISTAVSAADLENMRAYKVAKVAMVANATGNTYVFSWQNPETNKIIVREVVLNITTQAVAAAKIDVGVVASATDHSDTIFDGAVLNATGSYSSHNTTDTVGANATEKPHVVDENGGTTAWITGYESANQAYTALVGNVYIFYVSV